MDDATITKLQKQLHNTLPLIGGLQQRSAINKLAGDASPSSVPLLLEAMRVCSDEKARQQAKTALRNLSAPKAVDKLTEIATEDPSGTAAKICIETGKQPQDHFQRSIFLCLTGQIDNYFMQDKNFQWLHPAFLKADAKLKSRILQVMKKGDQRFLDFFSAAGSKPLAACTKEELEIALDLADKHKEKTTTLPLLLEAFEKTNATGQAAASKILRSIKSQEVIDDLCKRAIQEPSGAIASICVEHKKAPKAHADRCLFFFLTQQWADYHNAEKDGQGLQQAFDAATKTVQSYFNKAGSTEATEVLCKAAIHQPNASIAKLCIKSNYKPRDHEDLCLFLFVTRQLDEYFKEDYKFQDLLPAYERADETVRANVMEVVRSGDLRCQGFLGSGGRKPLAQCTKEEIKLAVDSSLRHKDWPRLFSAFLEMPMKYGFPLLKHFKTSGWEPAEPDLKSLYRQAILEAGDAVLTVPRESNATSSVFDRWLAEGRQMQNQKKEDLVKIVDSAAPPEAVKAVAALAAKSAADAALANKIKESKHWLVRLAGLATGMVPIDLIKEQQDANYWVGHLACAGGLLDFWPSKATPEDHEKLASAPPEAYSDKLGAVRRVLRLVVNHRATAPVIKPLIVEVSANAGQFIRE